MCSHGDTVERLLPDFVQAQLQRFNPVVDIDRCMEALVEDLWAAGVITGSVCCGHGRGGPEVVVFRPHAAVAHDVARGRAEIMCWVGDVLRSYNEARAGA